MRTWWWLRLWSLNPQLGRPQNQSWKLWLKQQVQREYSFFSPFIYRLELTLVINYHHLDWQDLWKWLQTGLARRTPVSRRPYRLGWTRSRWGISIFRQGCIGSSSNGFCKFWSIQFNRWEALCLKLSWGQDLRYRSLVGRWTLSSSTR